MKGLRVAAISVIVLFLVATLSLADDGSGGSSGFFQGLLGPVILLFQTAASLFDPAGSAKFAVLWEKTWGHGSTSYRIGFVAGVFILLTVFGGLGGSATKSAAKKDEKNKEEGKNEIS